MCQISRVVDLMQFQRFMRMMAARAGQLLNLNAVANDLSVAQITVRDWLAVLEASYIFFRLPPYHTNFGRRRRTTIGRSPSGTPARARRKEPRPPPLVLRKAAPNPSNRSSVRATRAASQLPAVTPQTWAPQWPT